MRSGVCIDTNLLLHACNEDSPRDAAAYAWLTSSQQQEQVAISQFSVAEIQKRAPGSKERDSAQTLPPGSVAISAAERNGGAWRLSYSCRKHSRSASSIRSF